MPLDSAMAIRLEMEPCAGASAAYCRQNTEAVLEGPFPAELYEEAKARLARAGARTGVRLT